MSQLDLAVDAEISTRHLSFVESGRSQPSREMLLHLAERLAVPLRERNLLMVSAGYAPVFAERPIGDPALAPARKAIELVLKGHEPYPALAIDRHWTLVEANAAVAPLLAGADPALLKPPVNVLRLSLHPSGLAPRIVNLAEWRAHLFERLRKQIEVSADPVLVALLEELRALPAPHHAAARRRRQTPTTRAWSCPLQLTTAAGVLSFLSTTTVFGTPVDVTLSEIALEAFFPADRATADALAADLCTGPMTGALRRRDRCANHLRQPKTGRRFA